MANVIKIYESNIKSRKRKYNPTQRYKDIIEQTNKRIEKHRRESDLVYERASKFFCMGLICIIRR